MIIRGQRPEKGLTRRELEWVENTDGICRAVIKGPDVTEDEDDDRWALVWIRLPKEDR